MTTAFIFPGQGSQSVGMGKALFENFGASRAVFEESDEALSEKLSTLIFDGPDAELTLTRNAQPALMTVSMAALKALESERGVDLRRDVAFVAGHSLGEYSALCAAGAFGVADAARLLRLRGEAMQKAVPAGEGAMAALLGLDAENAAAVAAEAAAATGKVCEVANDNAPGQVVVSGAKIAVERAIEIAKNKGARRAMLLPVSAPFHCALMQPAAAAMARALAERPPAAPSVPVVANMEAAALTDPAAIRDSLVRQVTGTVRWRESIAQMASQGVTRFVEIGAGKVLSGLVKRIAEGATVLNAGTPADIAAFSAATEGAQR
ncbi:MAG: ACP S-malonyltransferase [Hyphomicrobiales bacterium]|nr:ACP S-malonyltransferase [Hyphomicrobiales bacterium]